MAGKYHFKNLVFEGGGVKGIAYVGALKEIAVFRDHQPPEVNKIDNFMEFSWHPIMTMLSAQDNRHLHSDDWQRTIYIDTCGVKTTDFVLTTEKKEELVISGIDHTEKYFKWWHTEKEPVFNRDKVRVLKDFFTEKY